MQLNCWYAHHNMIGPPTGKPAYARWVRPDGTTFLLCRDHLDRRLDQADDGWTEEPAALEWLNGAWH
jgi:hypothetical protein